MNKENNQQNNEKCRLFIKCPEAEEMWDYEKNTQSPYDFATKSKTPIYWRCKNGHSFQRSVIGFVYKTKVCPECRSLQAMVFSKAHMMKFWDFEKNKGMDVKKIPAQSLDMAHWKCPKCGYEWEATIRTRKNDKCPCCDVGSAIKQGVNDFSTVVPELALDFDKSLNPDVDITMLGIGSHVRLKWRCHICSYTWESSIYGRIKKSEDVYSISKCPVCANNKRATTYDKQYPKLLEYFSEENNCKLTDLSGTDYPSTFKWVCKKHGVFEAALSSMIRAVKGNTSGCPYCSGKKVKVEESFGALHPDLVQEWSPDNECSPYEVTEKSSMKVKWVCSKGHKWFAQIMKRAQGQGFCRKCFPYGKNVKMFFEIYPQLRKNYSSKNKTDFKMHKCTDTDNAIWVCDKGHEFSDSFYNINNREDLSCPICNFRLIIPGINDFRTLYPQFAEDYNDEKNTIKAEFISPKNSNEDIYWICKKGHGFKRSVRSHIRHNGVCPVCTKHVLSKGHNDLLTRHPQIADIWDYENNEKNPEDCLDTVNRYYNFTCKKGHHYKASIEQIVSNHFKCLVCNNVIIQVGENSLIDTDPALATEWSPNNERGPETVWKGSPLRVFWKCPECGGEYREQIRNREVGDDRCPYCTDRKVLPGFNSFKVRHLDLMDEFLYVENYMIGVDPDYITDKYRNNVWWKCPTCKEKYYMSIKDRLLKQKRGHEACPSCSERRYKKIHYV